MKRYSLWVKCLVFFLAVVTLLGVAVGALGVLMAESMSMYTQDDYETWIYDRYHDMALNIADQAVMEYAGSLSDCPQWILEQTGHAYAMQRAENWFELSEGDWCYTIENTHGTILRNTHTDNFEKDALCFMMELDAWYPMMGESADYWEAFINPETDETVHIHNVYESGFRVSVWISRNHTSYYKNNGLSQATMRELFALRYGMIIEIAVSLLLFVVAFIFLMNLAGKDPRTGEANPRALNKLPLDLYLAAAVGLTVLGCAVVIELLEMLFDNDGYNVLLIVLLCGCGIIVATTDVGFFSAVAAQFKVSGGFWWKHSICGRVLKLAWKLMGKLWAYAGKGFRVASRGISRLFDMLPLMWEWVVVAAFFGLFLLSICATSAAHWYSVIPLFIWGLLFIAVVAYAGYCYGVIQKGIRRMREGDLNEKIDSQWMYGSFMKIAEDLNALADVVIVAAEKQMKSERMKAELITNVSHDIKTPLTSVINYVDLLQQPHTEEEGEQYLEVLSRQSLRLKKLVDDLMDMSKASSGNMTVSVTTLDAVETVNQALGEYADKLDGANLTPVLRAPEGQLQMQADGRLTWRVLSNLLGNVVKYALPGTRVYVDLAKEGRWVVCSIKNISREELNISAEELTERFVRGDASRNTEGSGLGLNIAQSLMHLQHGSMEVTVDGDLFKVTLAFPTE